MGNESLYCNPCSVQALQKHRRKMYMEALEKMLRELVKKDHYQLDELFLKPVDTNEYPEYLDIIKTPICIRDMM